MANPLSTALPLPAKRSLLPYLAMLLGVGCLGFSALFVRWAGAPGPVTGFYRMAIGSLVLVPLALTRRGKTQVRLPGIGVRLALLGGLFLSADLALWNTAIGLTRAANATLFGNAAPLWVALVALIAFGERLNGSFWVGLAITLAGGAAIAGTDFLLHPNLGWGDLLALGASVFYAGYYLATQRGRRWLDSASYVALVSVGAAVLLALLSLALGLPITGYSARSYLAFLGAGLISQALGYLAVGYALGHLPASVVSPTMVGQPVVTALLGIPLLGESLTLAQWLGGAAVLAGILLVHRSRPSDEGS
jgi:drug/metabolite transporter (DMT)-like permease